MKATPRRPPSTSITVPVEETGLVAGEVDGCMRTERLNSVRQSEDVVAQPAGAVAVPTISGRTNDGAFGSSVCSSSVTSKPVERIVSSVGRLQSQQTKNRLSRVHPILNLRQARVVRANVLDEEEPAAGPEHTADLAQRARLVVDAAEHERRDDGVETRVLEGKVFGRCAQDGRQRALLAGLPFQPLQHRRLRLGDRERLDARAVVAEVRAGAAADLEHVAARAGDQVPPHLGEAGLLAPFAEAVVGKREEPAAKTHRVPPRSTL